jgi:hypothetical protein
MSISLPTKSRQRKGSRSSRGSALLRRKHKTLATLLVTCGLLKTLRGSRRSARHYNSSEGSDRPCSFNRWKRGRERRGGRVGRSGWHGNFSQGKGSEERKEGRGGKSKLRTKLRPKLRVQTQPREAASS